MNPDSLVIIAFAYKLLLHSQMHVKMGHLRLISAEYSVSYNLAPTSNKMWQNQFRLKTHECVKDVKYIMKMIVQNSMRQKCFYVH